MTLVPEDIACPCCRAAMTMIGEDSSERLDVIPVQYRVIVTKRPKFACRTCVGTLVQAPAPARLIDGGSPTEALVAQAAIARFADHQPLYRQAQMMARQGVILDRSTLSFWVGYAAAEIAPVVARLREMMRASTRIFADETVVPVLDPGRGRTKQGYCWAIGRDDRPWRGSEPPAVVYNYAPGRGHAHAAALLGGYRGILQCDAYKAHQALVGAKHCGELPPYTRLRRACAARLAYRLVMPPLPATPGPTARSMRISFSPPHRPEPRPARPSLSRRSSCACNASILSRKASARTRSASAQPRRRRS